MNPKTDAELVDAICEGDVLSFEVLVKRYQRGLFHFVHRMLRNQHDSEEVVQDTFFRVYRSIEYVDTTKKFSTYIFEIAKNNAISLLRKHKKHISLNQIELQDDEKVYEEFARDELGNSVRRAVRHLDEKYRKAVVLYYFDDLSYEEVSKKLKVPINTVRTHLRRAKEELRKLLSS